jgi:phosphatidylglycerophosphatase C
MNEPVPPRAGLTGQHHDVSRGTPLATERPVLAVFDFDGTLTTADSLGAFLHLHLGTLRWGSALALQSPMLLAYALRLVSNHRAKATLLQHTLQGATQASLDATAEQLVQGWLPRHLDTWALDELQAHQQAGHTCVLLSASPDVYLRAVARALEIPYLICTRLDMRDGVCSGRLSTPNCHGEEKWRRLQAWFVQQGQPREAWEMHAYGDTRGDVAVLRHADQAWMRGKALS